MGSREEVISQVEVDGLRTVRCNQSHSDRKAQVELFPELGSLSDEELKQLKDDLELQERELSYQRRVLHGKIDILRAEIVARLQRTGGMSALDELDVDRLTDILTGKATSTE